MKHCIICEGQNQKMIYDNLLIKCLDCGFVTANLKIELHELKAIYSEKYFKGEAYDDYIRDKIEHQQNFNKFTIPVIVINSEDNTFDTINKYSENIKKVLKTALKPGITKLFK